MSIGLRRFSSSVVARTSPVTHFGLPRKSAPLFCAQRFLHSNEGNSGTSQLPKQNVGSDRSWTWMKRGAFVGAGVVSFAVLNEIFGPECVMRTYEGSGFSDHIRGADQFFNSRSEELKELKSALNRHSIGSVVGAPGSGKTQIARQYMETAKRKYKEIRYISLDDVSRNGKDGLANFFKDNRGSNLFVIDGINSEENLIFVLDSVKESRIRNDSSNHVMLVGRFSPIYPGYYGLNNAGVEISGLKEQEVLKIVEKVKEVSGFEHLSAKGMELLKDADGRYNPALLMSVAIRSGDLGLYRFDETLKYDSLYALYGQSRPGYRPLDTIYPSILKQYISEGIKSNIPGTEEYKICNKKHQILRTFAEAPLGKEFTQDDLKKVFGSLEHMESVAINDLVELSLVHRYSKDQKMMYRMDDAFQRYIASHKNGF